MQVLPSGFKLPYLEQANTFGTACTKILKMTRDGEHGMSNALSAILGRSAAGVFEQMIS
jgi:hypothetical protein